MGGSPKTDPSLKSYYLLLLRGEQTFYVGGVDGDEDDVNAREGDDVSKARKLSAGARILQNLVFYNIF